MGSEVNFYASESQYYDHLKPIWLALGGDMWTTSRVTARARHELDETGHRRVRVGTPKYDERDDNARVTVVASGSDAWRLNDHPVILVNHGAGQTYKGRESHRASRDKSYSGGEKRKNVILFLCPNVSDAVACLEANRKDGSRALVCAAGCTKLDRWRHDPPSRDPEPTIAVSFHSDLTICPETRWAWPHYNRTLADLAKRLDVRVIGHAHPRVWNRLAPVYERFGIEPVKEFEEVLQRAWVYAVDNSSTGMEFARATGRPILWLNAPWYRRDVNHGKRFWEWTQAAETIDGPEELNDALDRILSWDKFKEVRDIWADRTYSNWGTATKLSIQAIKEALNGSLSGFTFAEQPKVISRSA